MKFHIVTLGCPKNEVDSEGMEVLLTEAGHRPVAHFSGADLVVVNTCGFIDAARSEALGVLKELAAKKRPGSYLVAAGCLAQREGESLAHQVPGVDAVLGCRSWTDIGKIVELAVEARADRPAAQGGARGWGRGAPALMSDELQLGAVRRQPKGASAYLKISDGCDASCTFCIIPAIKGGYRSKPAEQVLVEARQLVGSGVQEIILVGQDTTAYGLDRGERDGLARLLRQLAEAVPDLRWLRMLYLYPQRITPDLVQALAELPQLVKYVDVPLQHTHPALLQRMGRPRDDVVGLVSRLRESIPDVAMRTTFIVGFPGETEDEHRHLLRTIEAASFDRVGVFAFSSQEGTRAAAMPDQVPEGTKQRRWREAMEVAQRVSLRQNRRMVGRELEVLVEGVGKGPHGASPTMAGRSYRDAPEVDGLVFFTGRAKLGEIVKVHITSALEYDLVGELTDGRGGGGTR